MRKNCFLIFCVAMLLVLISGGVIKHTLLRETRCELAWPYSVEYTIQVPDVAQETEDVFRGILYLQDGAAVGMVSWIEHEPSASGATGCLDLILHVKATAAGDSARQAVPAVFQTGEPVNFMNRYVTFTGTITSIEGE